jgi:hypothetical protein
MICGAAERRARVLLVENMQQAADLRGSEIAAELLVSGV